MASSCPQFTGSSAAIPLFCFCRKIDVVVSLLQQFLLTVVLFSHYYFYLQLSVTAHCWRYRFSLQKSMRIWCFLSRPQSLSSPCCCRNCCLFLLLLLIFPTNVSKSQENNRFSVTFHCHLFFGCHLLLLLLMPMLLLDGLISLIILWILPASSSKLLPCWQTDWYFCISSASSFSFAYPRQINHVYGQWDFLVPSKYKCHKCWKV